MKNKIFNFINNNKLPILLFIFVISMAIFLLTFVRCESDYYWHIKAGEYMFNNGILTNDVFSWFLSSKYWMSHEWLFEIIMYSFSLVFPKYHILIYSFVCICTLLLILFFANKEGYLKNIPFTMIWVVFSLILLPFMQGRPHLISFILLSLTIWALYDAYKNAESKKIYMLPILTIIWANVHGGSSNLIYLFCFVFMIVGLFQFKIGKVTMNRMSKKQIYKYLFMGIVCMLCININIHGFKMFVYPYQNMMDTTMLNNIAEWSPTNLNITSHYSYLLLVVIILFVFLFSKKKIDFMDLVLFGIAVFLGFKSIRFWSYTYIIMTFVVFNYIEKRKLDRRTNSIIIFVSVLLISLFITNFDNVKEQLTIRYLDDKVISIIKKEKPKRLYNMYDYGGELIYNDIKVFMDGRADLYSPYNYKDYLNMSNLTGDYVDLLDEYNFDYFLVDKRYPINTYLKYNNKYDNIYHNKKFILYKKNS